MNLSALFDAIVLLIWNIAHIDISRGAWTLDERGDLVRVKG